MDKPILWKQYSISDWSGAAQKTKKRKSISVITLLNPFQANILFLHRPTTSEHHRRNHFFSGVRVKWVKQNLYEQLNCERPCFKKWFFKLCFQHSRCTNLKQWEQVSQCFSKNYFSNKFYKYNPFYTNKYSGELWPLFPKR